MLVRFRDSLWGLGEQTPDFESGGWIWMWNIWFTCRGATYSSLLDRQHTDSHTSPPRFGQHTGSPENRQHTSSHVNGQAIHKQVSYMVTRKWDTNEFTHKWAAYGFTCKQVAYSFTANRLHMVSPMNGLHTGSPTNRLLNCYGLVRLIIWQENINLITLLLHMTLPLPFLDMFFELNIGLDCSTITGWIDLKFCI